MGGTSAPGKKPLKYDRYEHFCALPIVGRYYRPTSGKFPVKYWNTRRDTGSRAALPPANFWQKIASRKLQYVLNPDSDFDVLGLVEITTTSPTTICIETSLSSKGG